MPEPPLTRHPCRVQWRLRDRVDPAASEEGSSTVATPRTRARSSTATRADRQTRTKWLCPPKGAHLFAFQTWLRSPLAVNPQKNGPSSYPNPSKSRFSYQRFDSRGLLHAANRRRSGHGAPQARASPRTRPSIPSFIPNFKIFPNRHAARLRPGGCELTEYAGPPPHALSRPPLQMSLLEYPLDNQIRGC